MKLKFYYYYDKFVAEFDNNYKEWKQVFKNGDLQDFKNVYLAKYSNFYSLSNGVVVPDVGFRNGLVFKDSEDLNEYLSNSEFLSSTEEGCKEYLEIVSFFLYRSESGFKIDYDAYKNFEFGTRKIVEFLLLEHKIKQTGTVPKLKSNITQTQLVELVKALIENGTIEGTQKDLINSFADFFNIEIKNQNQLLQTLKKRNNGKETIFLTDLKNSLLDYISS